jgi:hypothetical protein
VSPSPDDRSGLEGCGRLSELELEPALRPIASHLASLRRRLAALADRLAPADAPPPEHSIEPIE